MNAKQIMDNLYPGMPQWQKDANASWLEAMARYVADGGVIGSPRDQWVVKKIREHEYEIVYAPGRGH